MTCCTLDPQQTIATVELLQRRIEERFPGAGLGHVAGEHLDAARECKERADWITLPEAGINDVVLVALALFLLVTIETRVKRSRTPAAVHELRSLAHVIDMHQLTKDPASLRAGWTGTASSPGRPMTAFELARYLDDCSELLSLTGKVAAVYAQESRTPSCSRP